MKNQTGKKPLIFAFGFDKLRVATKPDVEADSFLIRFVDYGATLSLEEADGVIIPSGIFETTSEHPNSYDGMTKVYNSDQHGLAEREKQVYNLITNGGWVCFLLQKIENGLGNRWAKTDLSKRFVNATFDTVGVCEPTPHLLSKSDDFKEFFHKYGIGRTFLGSPNFPATTRVLASAMDEDVCFAAEIGGKLFLLPFKAFNGRVNELEELIASAVQGILRYKKRNTLYLPAWLLGIRFTKEDEIEAEVNELKKHLVALEQEAKLWEEYKGILSASGRRLNEVVVSALRTFFELNLHSEEAFIEDAIIHDNHGKKLFVVEIKGVSGGIKREHINQVDNHRDRLGLGPEVPGLLIINDFADVEGCDERKSKQMDQNNLNLAVAQNVRVLRTTILLDFMLKTEGAVDRGQLLLKAIAEGSPLVSVPPLDP